MGKANGVFSASPETTGFSRMMVKTARDDVLCPLCDMAIDVNGGHVCSVAEILSTMSPTSGITRKNSCLSSFNSRCSVSSESSRLSKIVTFKEGEFQGHLEDAASVQTEDTESTLSTHMRMKGERVRTKCVLAARCKKEVPGGAHARVTGVNDELMLYEITTDDGLVIVTEPCDIVFLGFLPVKTLIRTAAPLTLTSADLTLQFPTGTTARIIGHNLEKNTLQLKFASGPQCDLSPAHVVPCSEGSQRSGSFFSRLLQKRTVAP